MATRTRTSKTPATHVVVVKEFKRGLQAGKTVEDLHPLRRGETLAYLQGVMVGHVCGDFEVVAIRKA